MDRREFEEQWRASAEPVLADIKRWRTEHPQATLEEIEAQVDARLAPLRAEMIRDIAQASAAADWRARPAAERPTCPDCKVPLTARGRTKRRLQTCGDQPLELKRCYGVCPRCARGFFPSG